MIGWRVWYADGSVLDSGTSTYDALPRTGLVGVMEYEDPEHRRAITCGDWYWMEDGRWRRSKTGNWGTWAPKPVDHAIKSTERLPADDYEAIRQAMMDAEEF